MSSTFRVVTYAVTWIAYPLGIASCLTRFYCRSVITKNWAFDDWVAVGVMLAIAGQLIQWQLFLDTGCALPEEESRCNYTDPSGRLLLLLWIQEFFYYFVHFLIKESFLSFYHRLSPDRGFRIMLWIGHIANIMILCQNELLSVFQCMPIIAAIKPFEYPDAKCVERLVIFFVPAGLNIILDIYILILPMRTVWTLQMPIRRKIAILSVFSFGISALLVGLVRFHSLISLNSNTNTSHGVGEMMIVAALEFNLATLAVNLPAMKCLWLKIQNKSSFESSTGPTAGTPLQQGYGLSTIGKKKQKSKMNDLGTITRLEQGVQGSESEEELWKKGLVGIGKNGGIVVSKDVIQEEHILNSQDRECERKTKYEPWGSGT
ncbi:hypothetical protein P280DRAFT_390538 [Massarina eburnea CBS 473.64]|uniref:Rhodopsin domain-containing protein n=1 Tax=Massarina eburnea CBS 473.64 TaxID=1395130 RepID=A0A6A6SFX3_9PLEO|nr:hypothetical protein P280DRAFT_390538 [Massarina eburnea CBS 473.64]